MLLQLGLPCDDIVISLKKMINLLPLENQRLLRAIYRKRFINITLVVLSFLFISSTIMLVPSYVIYKAKGAEALSRLGEFSEEDRQKTEEGLATIAKFKQNLGQIFPATVAGVTLSERLNLVLSVREEGLNITEISITDKKNFSLRGVAETRQDIISFVDALESIPDVTEVNSPISNLIAERDGTFVISFSFKN